MISSKLVIITCLLEDPDINLHLPLLLGGGHTQNVYIYIYTFNELTDFKDIYQVLTITSNEALTKQISKDYLKPPLTGALYVQYMY